MRITHTCLLVAAVLSGCGSRGDDTSSRDFAVVADVQELMAHVVEPSAQVYWGAVGVILDRDLGVLEIRPHSDEEWLAVENAAFMVAESGNLLMMSERRLDDEGWMALSRALVDIGRRAVEVAEARDEQAVFDVGAEMYYVCTQCHATYALETLRPSDDRAEVSGNAEDSGNDEGS